MTTSGRLAPLPLLLIGLAALAVLVLIPGIVHSQTTNNPATGRPVIVASAEGAPILFAEASGIRDDDGLPLTEGSSAGGLIEFVYSYQWIRVDGETETNIIGADSPRYRLVDADVGKLIKVEVSFTDNASNNESPTSLPFGPVLRPSADPSLSPARLVSNIGQAITALVASDITEQYAQGFTLGDHGQGYELSSVSIALTAVPSDLTVSLWIADHSDLGSTPETKLYDFENPSSLAVGANEFTAPAGVLLHQNVEYYIVLSDFGTSLSILETGSDSEDTDREQGATLHDVTRARALSSTGRWGSSTIRNNVLLLAVEGSKRDSGILASTYGQAASGHQEIISIGDECCISVVVGPADRYLIRGFSWNSDDTTSLGAGITNPWHLIEGSTKLFRLSLTRNIAGVAEYSAPQGATVEGGSKTYAFSVDQDAYDHIGDNSRTGHVLIRVFGTTSDDYDMPSTLGVTFSPHGDDISIPGLLAAVLGEPLYAMVSNLGQTDSSYATADSTNAVLSQGFTAGSEADGYQFQGIGVNIEDSGSEFPDGPSSVSVSVHADLGGKPGEKLFDLVSPGEFGAGHSFFEAPPGTRLEGSTSYVLVWRHNDGTNHRLQQTLSDGEDSGARTDFSIANALYRGADLSNLSGSATGHALEIVVYSRHRPNATGRPIVLASAEDAGVLAVDTSGIGDPDGIPNVGKPGSTGILHDFSYRWIRVDGDTETVVGADSADYRQIHSDFADSRIFIESGRYRRVDDDIGKLLKVEVSFTDGSGFVETVTSLPFGPVPRPARPLPESTLVGNTGQTPATSATITGRYAMGFELGTHGQGYEISSVSIDLAAAPSSLTVSLWMGRAPGSGVASAHTKLFEFENPSPFTVGLNRFTAPAGAFAYQNIDYFIVLSDFGASLSIKETTSDGEDAGGDTAAALYNSAGGDTSVLRLAVKGSRRDSGILASSYAQDFGPQEIVSLGDEWGVAITLGAADRYLIRGMSFSMDNTANGGGFTNPFDLLDGTTELFRLVNTRQINGISEWTAPQGATVAGGCTTVMNVETCKTYNFRAEVTDPVSGYRIGGVILSRYFGTHSTTEDSPTAPGVTLASPTGDLSIPRLLMAALGEPLIAMVQNLGQTDDGFRSVGGATNKVLTQGFTTGSDEFGYRLQGIGVNIEGSGSNFPDGPSSVSVAVHADSGGKPGGKLFDLVSPTEYAADHSFFEAPPETQLLPDTSYVMVWSHLGGTEHRMRKTSSSS